MSKKTDGGKADEDAKQGDLVGRPIHGA